MVVTNNHTASHLNNSVSITQHGAAPNSHTSISQPFFTNASNHAIPMPNSHPASSHMHSVEPTFHAGQCHGSFGPQQCAPNINSMMQNLNGASQFQSHGQFFVPGSMIPIQNFNPNASFPNRPFCFNNPMLNTGHLLSMQVNNGQGVPFNAQSVVPYNAQPCNPTLLHPNQVAQSLMVPQNPPIITDPSFFVQSNGVRHPVNQNQHNFCQSFLSNAPSCFNPGFGHSNASQNPPSMQNLSSSGVARCESNKGIPSNLSQNISHTSGLSNQVSQFMDPQNLGIIANPPIVRAQNSQAGNQMVQHQNNVSACQIHMNALNQPQVFTHNLQEVTPPAFCAIQPQQTFYKSQPHSGSQVIDINNGGTNSLDSVSKNSQTRKFTRNLERVAPLNMQRSHTHSKQNINPKFAFSNKNGRKGSMNDKTRRYDIANVANQARREPIKPPPLKYTEQEIQLWKDERKKNYPSKVNVEKKLKCKAAAATDSELRRQQLKEILAKQAELGVEIAEIPAQYLLSDAEEPKGRRTQKKREFRKNGRKRGRKRNEKRVKEVSEGGESCVERRKLTLLQKLLSGDMKRDARRLVQVIRFLVSNSFFKDWPHQPLKFPTVVVKPWESETHHLQPNGDEIMET